MRAGASISFLLVGLALSGPARRDCGQEKCYDAVNDCGMTYGGCWTECAKGLKEMPTFTAPPCDSDVDVGYGTQRSDATTHLSSTTVGPAESLITPPPSLNTTETTNLSKTTSCTPLWLCVDYLAVCGELKQMYGGCYDICTSSPPVTSPPCSLYSSTIKTGYAAATLSPEAGAAYTEKPATDNTTPAIDDSKAMVMAEMPPVSEPAAPAPAVEFRLANANAEEPAASPATEASTLVEAPANLRGAAIAKIQADNVRKPNTENVPCWDRIECKEVQLGIPSPAPSQSTAASSTAVTAEPSSIASTETPSDAPTETLLRVPSETPIETPTEATAQAPTDAPAEETTEAPA